MVLVPPLPSLQALWQEVVAGEQVLEVEELLPDLGTFSPHNFPLDLLAAAVAAAVRQAAVAAVVLEALAVQAVLVGQLELLVPVVLVGQPL